MNKAQTYFQCLLGGFAGKQNFAEKKNTVNQ